MKSSERVLAAAGILILVGSLTSGGQLSAASERGSFAPFDEWKKAVTTHSVAVERQYSGTLGKTGNCQIAVSVHHVGEQGNVPLGWRLYLPESWAKDAKRRREAGIPEGIVFRKKWELALEIIDQIREWGLPDRVVL